MGTDIERYQPRAELAQRDVVDGWTDVIEQVSRLSTVVAETDFVPKTLRGKPAAITACILAGREVGIPPMRALQHLHMVDGRPTMSAEQKRAQALAAGHDIVYVETTTERCVVKGRRHGQQEWTTVTFTMDDARKAKLAGKDNYQKWPRRMLQARATGELCDMLFPDATGGLTTWEQALDETDAAVVESNGHTPAVRQTARRRTAVAAAPAQHVVENPAQAAPADLPPLPGEPGYDDPDPPTAEEPGPLTAPQRQKILAIFNGLGIKDRADRLALSAGIVNRLLPSANDLTSDEASALIDTLERAAQQDDPRAWLDQLVGSVEGELVDDEPGEESS